MQLVYFISIASKKVKVVEDFDPEAPIYDDCNDIRCKIRAHLAEGNKIIHFLKELGENRPSLTIT